MFTFEPVEVTREEVPTAYRTRIDNKLAKLTKRLAKLNAPAPTVEYGPVVHVPYPLTAAEELWVSADMPRPTYPAYETVTVHGFEAKIDGWTGVAVLDWTVNPDEAFVARFPGHDDETTAPDVSDELRTRGAVCDHCGTKRRRNTTIVFANDDGRMIGVGTGCVLEYLGVDPRTILMLSDFVRDINDDDFANVKPSLATDEFVALAAEITKAAGFVRSAEAGSTKEATLAIGVRGLTTGKADEWLREIAADIDMERGRAKAAAIAEWLAADTDGSDFMRSARVAFDGNPVTMDSRAAGILAALPFSHDRHLGVIAEREAKRKAEAEARKTADFIGEVGDRLTVKGTVVFYNTYDGFYGTSARLTVATEDGNRVTTYGSGNTLFGWDVGDNVEWTGTVKGHDDHERFGKSTEFTRVKVTELDENFDPLPKCGYNTAAPGKRARKCGLPVPPKMEPCDDCGGRFCPMHTLANDKRNVCEACLEARHAKHMADREMTKAMLAANAAMTGRKVPTYFAGNPFPAEILNPGSEEAA